MNELHNRINKVINTVAFEACLNEKGVNLFEFQASWRKLSEGGKFNKLPKSYQDAIIAGERELACNGELELA